MTEKSNMSQETITAAAPKIRKKRSLSFIWLVPLVALCIGGWLIYKTVSERGPVITISFETAEGLEAGKTKVKYKNIEVGLVESITIGEDISKVLLTIKMVRGSEPYLTDKTKFWVVKARVSADRVTGLNTLLGGAYIGSEPSSEGKSTRHFVGLEKPPVVTHDMKGKHFHLTTPRLGSLEAGSPIYFRQIKVGQVVDYTLDEKGGDVDVDIFIHSPYDKFVRENSRFWHASGLDLELSADGLRVDTESFMSMLIGGITFGLLPGDELQVEAKEKTTFKLYENMAKAIDDKYSIKEQYYIEFKESVRGLSVGAPVEFQGLKIGKVEDIELKADFEELRFSILVLISIERERMDLPPVSKEELRRQLYILADRGLRAHLKTGNLLTGQLFVDLDYFPDAPKAVFGIYNDLYILPSMPSSSRKIMQDVSKFVQTLDQLPVQEIADNINNAVKSLDRFLNNPDLQGVPTTIQDLLVKVENAAGTLDSDTLPNLNSTIKEVEILLKDLDGWFSTDSLLYDDLVQALRDVSEAAQAIDGLADLLERHPEALIQGKNSEEQL